MTTALRTMDLHEVSAPVSGEVESVEELRAALARAQAALAESSAAPANRLSIDPNNLRQGLGQLVLTLVKLLHQLLERQAIRRMEGGSLTDKQVEDVGMTLMRQAEEISRLATDLGLREEDLNIDLGPIGRLF